MIKTAEKRWLGAYWLLQSFERTCFNDMDLILYMGAHKPRQEGTKHMEEVQNDPDAFLPKMDVSVFTHYNTGESWPIYAKSMASIIAGITLLHDTMFPSDRPLEEKTEFLVKMWASRDDIGYKPYVEFNPNKIRYVDLCKHAEKYGTPILKVDINDPLSRIKNILWLKGSEIVMSRPLRDKRNTFIKDVMIVGKDIKRNEIVLGLKKSWKNYTRIIPLYENGLNFVASIRYMTVNKPTKYPLVTLGTLERIIQEKMDAMKEIDLVYADFMLPVPELLEIIEA